MLIVNIPAIDPIKTQRFILNPSKTKPAAVSIAFSVVEWLQAWMIVWLSVQGGIGRSMQQDAHNHSNRP
ncbi:MAG: hypothetical protein AAGJ40_21855 [Planctomycetota bacterium]